MSLPKISSPIISAPDARPWLLGGDPGPAFRRPISLQRWPGKPIRRIVALAHNGGIVAVLLVASSGLFVRAQTQLLPEVDTYLRVNSVTRAYFQAEGDRDAGVPIQSTIGPSLQFYLKPLLKLKKVTAFDLDDAKKRPLVLEAGYRVIAAPNEAVENRFMPMATAAFPLKGLILITDRSRADLDWKAGVFSWRYRNRLLMQRTISIFSYHLTPYLSAEPYYTSQYSKWSTTQLEGGCLFPIGTHVQIDAYYEHQNNTGKKPNEQINDVGLAAHLFFSLKRAGPRT